MKEFKYDEWWLDGPRELILIPEEEYDEPSTYAKACDEEKGE